MLRLKLILSLCLVLLSSPSLAAELQVRSAILMDISTGQVLYAQNADRKIAPASLTKIMSMFLAMEALQNDRVDLYDRVKISFNASSQTGSRMHLRPNERVSFERLLQGMAISSGNDASMAVAEYLGKGTSNSFVRSMNNKAKTLGMTNTNFVNPHGLPANRQLTTARDMAKLSRAYLLKFPTALRYHKMQGLKHNGRVTTNKNPLLNTFPGADGLKTGWVVASGYNLISTVRRGNTRLIAVVMGAKNPKVREAETCKLLEAGFKVANSPNLQVANLLQNSPSKATVRAKSKQAKSKKSAIKTAKVKSKKNVTSKSKKNSIAKTKNNKRKQQLAKTKSTVTKKSQAKAPSKNTKNTARTKSKSSTVAETKNKPRS